MNLSKTSKYAIRILSLMAITEKQTVSAAFVVKELKISDKYARSLMTKLSKANLITALQGRNGGYMFKKSPEKICLSDIINAVEDINKYYSCLMGFSDCLDEAPCALHEKWSNVKKILRNFLETTYLKDIHGEIKEKNKYYSIN